MKRSQVCLKHEKVENHWLSCSAEKYYRLWILQTQNRLGNAITTSGQSTTLQNDKPLLEKQRSVELLPSPINLLDWREETGAPPRGEHMNWDTKTHHKLHPCAPMDFYTCVLHQVIQWATTERNHKTSQSRKEYPRCTPTYSNFTNVYFTILLSSIALMKI
jgi:hypothetical protein